MFAIVSSFSDPWKRYASLFSLQLCVTVISGRYVVGGSDLNHFCARAFNCWYETLQFPLLPAAKISLNPGSTLQPYEGDVMWARGHCLTKCYIWFFSAICIWTFFSNLMQNSLKMPTSQYDFLKTSMLSLNLVNILFCDMNLFIGFILLINHQVSEIFWRIFKSVFILLSNPCFTTLMNRAIIVTLLFLANCSLCMFSIALYSFQFATWI